MRLVILLLLLAGCAANPSQTVTVKVPVEVPCNAPAVAVPVFPVDMLTGSENEFEIGRALWADIEVREAYEQRLRAAVEACRAK